jgi:hypothetical protein
MPAPQQVQQQQMEAFSIFTMHFSSGAPFPVSLPNKVCATLQGEAVAIANDP